ncbi:MAG: four helix bundle protein [Ignavibacteriae bacterium]|nr:four helix bundle protein [Ignavibacteriota bacterium]
MNKEQLKLRTKQFALQIMKTADLLPHTKAGEVVTRQLIRAATSVGANYRSACRARSKADFISKVTIVEEEADECLYWLELIAESRMLPAEKLGSLMNEARELTAIFTASGRTARTRNSQSPIRNPK